MFLNFAVSYLIFYYRFLFFDYMLKKAHVSNNTALKISAIIWYRHDARLP